MACIFLPPLPVYFSRFLDLSLFLKALQKLQKSYFWWWSFHQHSNWGWLTVNTDNLYDFNFSNCLSVEIRMLCGKNQMLSSSSRSLVQSKGGRGTQRLTIAWTARENSHGWCVDTTAGQFVELLRCLKAKPSMIVYTDEMLFKIHNSFVKIIDRRHCRAWKNMSSQRDKRHYNGSVSWRVKTKI